MVVVTSRPDHTGNQRYSGGLPARAALRKYMIPAPMIAVAPLALRTSTGPNTTAMVDWAFRATKRCALRRRDCAVSPKALRETSTQARTLAYRPWANTATTPLREVIHTVHFEDNRLTHSLLMFTSPSFFGARFLRGSTARRSADILQESTRCVRPLCEHWL